MRSCRRVLAAANPISTTIVWRLAYLAPAMLTLMKRVPVKIPEPNARLRDGAEGPGSVGAETSRAALEPRLDSPSGRRTLGAAAAGRSGHHDVSERVSEILAAEDAGAT